MVRYKGADGTPRPGCPCRTWAPNVPRHPLALPSRLMGIASLNPSYALSSIYPRPVNHGHLVGTERCSKRVRYP